jgi:hypothetical protein
VVPDNRPAAAAANPRGPSKWRRMASNVERQRHRVAGPSRSYLCRVSPVLIAVSLIDVAGPQASTLTASGEGFASYGRPCRCAGLTRSKSWSQTLRDTRYAPANQTRSRMLCGVSVPTAATRGIEADVGFIPRASEPTS